MEKKSHGQLYLDIRANLLPRKLIAQNFQYYDGAAFSGLPFGQIGDHGVPVRSETLVMTEENLQAAYPQLPPTCNRMQRQDGQPNIQKHFVPALHRYTFANGSDHRTRGYFVQAARLKYDFQNSR